MRAIKWAAITVIVLAVFGGCMAVLSGGSDSNKPDTPSVKSAPKAPPAEPKAEDGFPSGDYVVGEDIPPGRYETKGATPGVIDYCDVQTDGSGPGGDGFGQWENGGPHERIIITLTEADGKLSLSGCEPLLPRNQ